MRSLLLILLSVGLVATWVYHFYDKSFYSQPGSQVEAGDSITIAHEVRDSLQKIYTAALNDLDDRLDSTLNNSDSLQNELETKVREINRLKSEIASILKNPQSRHPELKLAREKMKQMEAIMNELREQKGSLEEEKLALNTRLNQVSGEVDELQKNIRRLDEENKKLNDKIKAASIFVASALHFTAINVKEAKEQETSQAKKADKLVASFALQNNFNDYMNAEIVIAIVKPDGNILQSTTWDSGTFDTRNGGRKNFTRKIRFDYTKGEQKVLVFSLDVESLAKGVYTLQIWQDGLMIGEIAKTMS